MTRIEARIEALKLAARPGLDTDSILTTAEAYYCFLVKDSAPEAPVPAKAPKK